MGKFTSHCYEIVARIITRELSRYKEIKGVYLRGSTCSGDAILGKSDIDIVVIIENFRSPAREAKLLYQLTKHYFRLKCICPFLGEYLIFNSQDFRNWYGNTYRAYRAKKWIVIYGEPVGSDFPELNSQEILREVVWWNTNYLFRGLANNDVRFFGEYPTYDRDVRRSSE